MASDDQVKILLVDDHPENLLALESVLEDLGQELVRATSGIEALKQLLDDDFAVVLLDVQMPGMDGFETASLIRAREKTRHTPIVFLTAINKSDFHVTHGYSVGAVDYLFKPFQPEVLRAKVSSFVELARKTKELKREVLQRQKAEQEVRKLNARLEARVRERTRALEAANKELNSEIAERRRMESEREQLFQGEQTARIAAEEAVRANDELLSALRTSEEQYRVLAEAIPHLVWTARPDGGFDYWNRRWYEYTGLSEAQSLETGWWQAVHPEDRERCRRELQEMLELGEVYDTEARLRRADGCYRWHLARGLPVRDSDGRLRRWFGTCTDIDDQKRAAESLRFQAEASTILSESLNYEETLQRVARLVVPQVADCCMVDVFDEQGFVERLSIAHRRPESEARAWELWKEHPPRPTDPNGVYEVFRTGHSELVGEIPDELLARNAESEGHFRLLRALKLKSYMVVPLQARGRMLGAISFLTDDSSDRSFTAADLQLAEDLARRAANAVDNARLFREVQEADRAKDQFLAMLGHELRNPLAPIRNAVATLRARGIGDPHLQKAREVIERQAVHMTRLVDDLLDVSRITSGRIGLRKSTVDLAAAVRNAVETARPAMEAQGHTLDLELPAEPIWVLVDETRVEQVITNLLNNAAKYSDSGSHVWVTLRRDGSEAVLRVRDTGVGIAPDMLARIWDPFAQADRSLDRAQGGLGLGLTLVRTLVEMHGGSVSAQSEGLGRGSTFEVRLPIPATAERPAETEGAPPSPRGVLPASVPADLRNALRVLVVDDNVDAAETLAELLELWGCEVQVVHDGVSAVEAACSDVPDIVFLDIGLPGMDGYEVARRIRRREAETAACGISLNGAPAPSEDRGPKPILLVAVTGYGQDEDRRRSQEARLDYHLTKPIDPDQLQAFLGGLRQQPALS